MMEILGQLVQRLLEPADHVDLALVQGVQDGHQDPTGMSPSVRLGPAADVARMTAGRRFR